MRTRSIVTTNIILLAFAVTVSVMSNHSNAKSCGPNKKNSIPESMPSFYQRKLPETCVAFASRQGKKIFKSALESNGMKCFYNLIEQHHTQTEPAYCGVSTLVMILNALSVDPGQHWKGPWRWYSEKMLNCCVDMEDIKTGGITLRDFHCLALCQGLSVDVQYCDEKASLQSFREAVKRVCIESSSSDNSGDEFDSEKQPLEVMAISYSRAVLKQTGSGHFSPLAAYDRASDSVLILDTARFKYGAHWTKVPLVFDAMKPVDPDTGKSRGYAILSFTPKRNDNISVEISKNQTEGLPVEKCNNMIKTSVLSTQPASILFRSKMNQKELRKIYKEYISSLREEKYKENDIPYGLVRAFWCESRDESDVWKIIEPLLINNKEEIKMLHQIRNLLLDLMDACNAMNNNKIDTLKDTLLTRVSLEETLFFIYLATLSKEKRYEVVMNVKSEGASEMLRKEVIKEADRIASAIEVSDQLTSI